MKTRKKVFILAIAGMTFLVASCSETINSVEESIDFAAEEKSSETTMAPGDCCTFTGTLTDTEIAGLMEMREEEKLARDVYTALYEEWEHIAFNNISKSESAHTRAVLYLINGYGLSDPTPEGTAEFNNPLFADLYAQLTAQGSESLAAALKTGAFIEEYDIADLERLLEETQNEDIKRVYSHLLAASKIHLRAFTNALKRIGETYTPTVITVEEYEEILGDLNFSSDTETDFTPGLCDGTGPNA